MRSIPFNAARPQQPPGRFPLIFHRLSSLMRQHRRSPRSQARITAAKTIQRPSRIAGSKNQRRTSYPRFGHHCSKANCGIAGERDRGFPACLFTHFSTCYAAWLPAYFTCLRTLSPVAISWGLAALTHAAEPPSHDALLQVPRTCCASLRVSGIINPKQYRTGRTAHDHQRQHHRRPPP